MTSQDDKTDLCLCRICLQNTKDKFLCLFESFKEFCPAYYINLLTDITINQEDTLPDKICKTCLSELDSAINFKLKCETSNEFLHQTLYDINAETILPTTETLQIEKVNEGTFETTHELPIKKEIDTENYDDTTWFLEEDNDYIFETKLTNTDVNRKDKLLTDTIKIDVPAKSPVICHDCGGVFQSKCKLRVHWKKVHKQRAFYCDLCKIKFVTMNALKNHKIIYKQKCKILSTQIITGSGKDRIFICPICKYSTKQDKSILQHIPIHTGERKFKCNICDSSFVQRASRNLHVEQVHKIYKKIITCDICGLKLNGQQKFYRHVKRLHSGLYYECDICHKKLKSKSTLRDHMMRHEGLKNFSCEFCPRVVTTSAELLNHRKYCHFNLSVKKMLNCPLCQYKTVNKKVMNTHTKKHESSCDLPCETCGNFYDTELNLWLHKICHFPLDAVARRTCPFCGRLFEKNGFMRKHMLCHLRNKRNKKYDVDEVISRVKEDLAVINDQKNHRKKKRNSNLTDNKDGVEIDENQTKVEENESLDSSVVEVN